MRRCTLSPPAMIGSTVRLPSLTSTWCAHWTRSRLTAKAMRYPIADGDSPFSPEQFVERSGRLKKHFEAVLALDREAHPVDEQLHIWVTCPTALMGGMCGFVQHLHSRKRIYLPTGRPQGAKVNDENRIHRQAIRDGRDFSTEIEGLSELEPNTRDVTKPTDDLRKGLEVAVKSLQAK
jgi:hypothetical protein